MDKKGNLYEGHFKNNKLHGPARVIKSKNYVIEGNFKDGNAHGYCKVI